MINKGQELYKKAKKIIPGGTMLFSKNPDNFLPDRWPTYFSKAKGKYIWDLDGNLLKDMSLMGVGTNVLGYSNKEIDSFIINKAKLGNLSTLNCPEEVMLAEKLIAINPWAHMVRYARTGGEANAIAIRIARAASGRDKVAICGYHGWHDWYLSINHNSVYDNLSDHLMSGISSIGVPKYLKDSVFPFEYNNFEMLEKITSENDIGVIKMEVQRNFPPTNNFLKKVRSLATKKNIVLIFDECSSGFRETFGGLYIKHDIEPDIVIFGKTLGNGYAITAVVGKKDIMGAARNSFISSTFWTERIGPSAAIKTLELMEKLESWNIITDLGNLMRNKWKKISDNNNIELEINGIPAMSSFNFLHKDNLKFKTFITQEFLKKDILATSQFYPSICHNERDINEYAEIFNDLLFQIKKCVDGEKSIDELLEVKSIRSGFKRFN